MAGRGRPKKIVKHAGVVAQVEEEDIDDIKIVDSRKKSQDQPSKEKFWTPNSIEAEKLQGLGFKIIGVYSAFENLPKRWVFDATKEEIEAKKEK